MPKLPGSTARHGGAGRGQGRKPLPLIERKVKISVTLSLIAVQEVEERREPNEPFSSALDRILCALPIKG